MELQVREAGGFVVQTYEPNVRADGGPCGSAKPGLAQLRRASASFSTFGRRGVVGVDGEERPEALLPLRVAHQIHVSPPKSGR